MVGIDVVGLDVVGLGVVGRDVVGLLVVGFVVGFIEGILGILVGDRLVGYSVGC